MIADTIKNIEADFHDAALRSYKAMKADFDFTTNVEKYMYMINKAKRIDVDKITIPQSGLIRKVLFKHMTK